MVRALLIGMLLAAGAAAAPVPKDFIKPKPKLDGKWQVTAYESNGRPVKSTAILNQTWAFDGESLAITRANAPKGVVPTKVKVRVDAKARPVEFDYILSTASTRLGVLEIDGDTLTICMTVNTSTGVRPTDLNGGTGILKYVFKRVDK